MQGDVPSMREMILQEATALFLQRGYNGVSMREIAEACGLSKAGLYYHFTDKQALFLAILEENMAALAQVIRRTKASSQSTRERMAYFARALFSQLAVNQRSIIRLASQELRNLQPEAQERFLRQYHTEFIDAMAAMLEEGMQSGELCAMTPQTAAWALLGLLYPFLDIAAFDEEKHTRMIDDVLRIYFDGISKK